MPAVSKQCGAMPPRRRHPTSPPATPLDDEDLLAEFLLRLQPRPSSLPRAAAVCKAWRRIVTDPHFLRRFRAHHRKPPLLGFYDRHGRFFPTLQAPDRVPAARLSVSMSMVGWNVVGCRDGLVLWRRRSEIQVLDPMTGDRSAILSRQDKLPIPLTVETLVVDSTGVDRRCFRLFALSTNTGGTKLSASVYSSHSGTWAHSVEASVSGSAYDFIGCPGTLAGNVFDWTHSCRILRYDLETQTLAIIELPWNQEQVDGYSPRFETVTPDGVLGIIISFRGEPNIYIWVREIVLSSADKWVPRKTGLLNTLLPLELQLHWPKLSIMGFEKENNVIFLGTPIGVFMINIESMKFTKVSEETHIDSIYPYSSFVTTDAR